MAEKLNRFSRIAFFTTVLYLIFVIVFVMVWLSSDYGKEDDLILIGLGLILFLVNTALFVVFFRMGLRYLQFLQFAKGSFR